MIIIYNINWTGERYTTDLVINLPILVLEISTLGIAVITQIQANYI